MIYDITNSMWKPQSGGSEWLVWGTHNSRNSENSNSTHLHCFPWFDFSRCHGHMAMCHGGKLKTVQPSWTNLSVANSRASSQEQSCPSTVLLYKGLNTNKYNISYSVNRVKINIFFSQLLYQFHQYPHYYSVIIANAYELTNTFFLEKVNKWNNKCT